MASALYICYFGINEPLVQTQVLPYLRELIAGGHTIALVTFEPSVPEEEALRERLASDGIEWHWLRYHKRLSVIATAWDILCGTLFTIKFINRNSPDLLHARVHVPMLMAAIARKLSRGKPKILFDIRGFFPEEYVDAGVWPAGGWLYRLVKRAEKWLMKESDGFVVLTEKARDILFPATVESSSDDAERPVAVIPCCVDLAGRFQGDRDGEREIMRAKLGVEGRLVVTHVGALGGLYLSREIADLLVAAREIEPTTFAMFLTQSDPGRITSLLQERGFTENEYFVGKVDPGEIPLYLSACDIGLSFVRATYATQSRSPTKIPEYLAAGVPLIANSGVGDVDRLIADEGIGVLIDSFDREAYVNAITSLKAMGNVSDRCRETAARRFDLKKVGGVRYREIYARLLDSGTV